ncbi:MAG: class I SAM-dependent methyltransferase [Phycisphaerae bacterium]
MTQQSSQHFNFDKIASSYDNWYDSARGAMYDRLEKQAIGQLLPDVTKHTRLLEIGCGTGHWSRYFSNKGFDVTGIDISAEMIKIARQKQIPNSRFEIADGRNLPFEDESFDVAAAITVLEFASEPEKIISEMIRCIKKSNSILIIGVLNALSGYNQKRKKELGSVYSSSHLFSPKQIQELLSRYGEPKMRITGFVPDKEWLLWSSPLWEYLSQFFCLQKGVFIAVRVDL